MATNNAAAKIVASLAEATANRDAARIAFSVARKGSRRWMEAGDDLDFLVGKVASLSGLLASLGGAR